MALLLALALLAGCQSNGAAQRSGDSSLAIAGLEQTPAGEHELVLAIRLARPLRQALESGVPLTFRLDLDSGSARHSHWRELRFAPLSRRYQIHEPATGYRRSYDSRAAALTALERWPVELAGSATDRGRAYLADRSPSGGANGNAGDPGTEADSSFPASIKARVRLDTARLPAPLVLPALFYRDWQLDSGRWHAGQA
ncbi:MAG: DUF4390 domain-containing protein [Xanthomonadales bacterium]|nr:DUF4390 domain-containing protein [Xanthomonadales bacterium]